MDKFTTELIRKHGLEEISIAGTTRFLSNKNYKKVELYDSVFEENKIFSISYYDPNGLRAKTIWIVCQKSISRPNYYIYNDTLLDNFKDFIRNHNRMVTEMLIRSEIADWIGE